MKSKLQRILEKVKKWLGIVSPSRLCWTLETEQCAFSNKNEIEESYQYYMKKNFGKEENNGKHNI